MSASRSMHSFNWSSSGESSDYLWYHWSKRLFYLEVIIFQCIHFAVLLSSHMSKSSLSSSPALINQLVYSIIVNSALMWDFLRLDFLDTANFSFDESSPVLERSLRVIFWDLHDSNKSFFVLLLVPPSKLVHNHSEVTVDRSEVSPEKMLQRHLIVMRNEIHWFNPKQPHINVLKSSIHMMIDDIVVKYIQVQDEDEPVYDESNDNPCKPSVWGQLVVVVELEHFSSGLTSCDVDDCDQKRVSNGWETPPNDELGYPLRHVLDEPIAYPGDENAKYKPEWDSHRADEDAAKFLVWVPEIVGYIYSPPLNSHTRHWHIDPLQINILEQIMQVDPWK